MTWLEFVTTLENADIGITEENICDYEDEIFNYILANFDSTHPKGSIVKETLIINKNKIELEFPVIQGEFDTEPGKVTILRINNKKVGM